MLTEEITEAIYAHLFDGETGEVYTVLDGASVPDLPQHLAEFQPEHECLFAGALEPDMAEVAPYLVHLNREADFTRWVIEQGWGNHWGIFARSEAGLRAMRRHFRSFLKVEDQHGKSLIFRYYDPRVLRLYLPTCNEQELTTVFGPVAYYMLEDADARQLLRYQIASGSLREEKRPLIQE